MSRTLVDDDYMYSRQSIIDSHKKNIGELKAELDEITQNTDKIANETAYIPKIQYLLGRVFSYERALELLEMTK